MSSAAAQIRARLPRLHDAASLRERLALVPPRMSEAPRTPFVALLCGLLAAGVVGLLMFNTHMQQGAFVGRSLQKQADQLAAQQQQLTMELQRLGDPQQVAARAQGLGMVPAPQPVFLNSATGQVIGVPKPATAKDGLQITYAAPKPAELNPAPQIVTVPAPQQSQPTNGAASTPVPASPGNTGTPAP